MDFIILIESTEPQGYIATAPELPGCTARGDTVEQADRNLTAAVADYLESLRLRAEFESLLDATASEAIDVVVTHAA